MNNEIIETIVRLDDSTLVTDQGKYEWNIFSPYDWNDYCHGRMKIGDKIKIEESFKKGHKTIIYIK